MTISLRPAENSPLVGIRLRVVSSTEVKALDATELYFLETSGDLLGAYIQAAYLLICLRLESVPLDLYYDTAGLVEPNAVSSSPAFDFWTQLIGTFVSVEWHPVSESVRSPKMEALRWKLNVLSTQPSNEIKSYDSHQLAGIDTISNGAALLIPGNPICLFIVLS